MSSLSTLKALLTILSGLSVIISPSTIGRDIVFPRAQSDTDHRTNFPTTLLTKILAQSSAEDKLVPTKFYAQQDRALKLLADKEIDILWTATSIDREREFRPIRIPIYRGLLGWRIALINAQNSNLLASVNNLEQLQQFSIGAGGGWPEVPIFSHNGFTVHTTTTYNGLFEMLSRKRFQLFPRSIVEIQDEVSAFSHLNLVSDKNVLMQYPYALYFFVNKTNNLLAQQIESGFVSLIENGEYEKLFQQFVRRSLDSAEIGSRTRVRLHNPYFPVIEEKYKDYFMPF